MNLWDKYKTLLKQITNKAHFFAQLDVESGLKPINESLYYTTVERAKKTFYSPFKDKSNVFIEGYLRDSVKMANYVYANRMGNGEESSSDGYKYRGRGFIQLTGKNNYIKYGYTDNPDLLLNEADAMVCAVKFWVENGLNKYMLDSDLDTISDLVNIGRKTKAIGDSHNFKERKEKYLYYKKIFVD